MKIKSGFIIRQVAGENVVLPCGDNAGMNIVISLNDTGAFLWRALENESTVESLVEALLGEYAVERNVAENSVNSFLNLLRQNKFLEE